MQLLGVRNDSSTRICHQGPLQAGDGPLLKPGTPDDTSWFRPEYLVWMKNTQGSIPVPNGVKALQEQRQLRRHVARQARGTPHPTPGGAAPPPAHATVVVDPNMKKRLLTAFALSMAIAG